MDFYLTPPTNPPTKFILRELFTPGIQRIESICAIGTVLQQVLLIFVKSLGALCFYSYKNRISHIATRLLTLNLSNVGDRTTSKQTNDLSICLTDAPAYTSTYPTHTSPKTQRTMYTFVHSAPHLLDSLFCLHSALSFVARWLLTRKSRVCTTSFQLHGHLHFSFSTTQHHGYD